MAGGSSPAPRRMPLAVKSLCDNLLKRDVAHLAGLVQGQRDAALLQMRIVTQTRKGRAFVLGWADRLYCGIIGTIAAPATLHFPFSFTNIRKTRYSPLKSWPCKKDPLRVV